MDKHILLKNIGKLCQNFRVSIQETQLTMSLDVNYSVESISSFENGRNNNMVLLLWYLSNGLDIDDLCNLLKGELKNDN